MEKVRYTHWLNHRNTEDSIGIAFHLRDVICYPHSIGIIPFVNSSNTSKELKC